MTWPSVSRCHAVITSAYRDADFAVDVYTRCVLYWRMSGATLPWRLP